MREILIKLVRNVIMFIGYYASKQMCFGFLHEIQVPKELEEE